MATVLTEAQIAFCKSMAALFWWKKTEELPEQPERTLAGVMDRGDVRAWRDMERLFDREFLIRVLETAVCGEFHSWSWCFWRSRCGLDANVPLPARLPGFPPPSGDVWYKELQRKTAQINMDDPAQRLAWTWDLRRHD